MINHPATGVPPFVETPHLSSLMIIYGIPKLVVYYLVGGLEHVLFSIQLGIIIPTEYMFHQLML